MTIEEQAALEPKQLSCSMIVHGRTITLGQEAGKVENKEWADFQQFKKGRKLEPDSYM
mgnify:CR=1 FL=1